MNKFINYTEFMHYLIDDEKAAEKGGEIVKGILKGKSPRLTNIAEQMDGQSESNYKAIHRFIGQTDVKEGLLRLSSKETKPIRVRKGAAVEVEKQHCAVS